MVDDLMHRSVIVNSYVVAAGNVLVDHCGGQTAFLHTVQNGLLHTGGAYGICQKDGAVQLVVVYQIKDVVFSGIVVRVAQHAAKGDEMTDVDVMIACKFVYALQDVMLVFFVNA